MEFEARTTPEEVEIRLKGRFEFTDHERLRDLLAVMEAAPAQQVALNLADLSFIDSAGLGMLLIIQEEAETRKLRLAVRKVHGEVRRSIELARIDAIMSIED